MSRTRRLRLSAPQRREAILDAALLVFSERGYHGSSIDEVARAAGISKALIYEHFAGKQDLHLSLVALYAEELFGRLAASAAPGVDAEVRLRRGVDAFLGFVEQHRTAWKALFRDAADPELGEVLARFDTQATGVIAQLILAEPAAQEAPDPDRDVAIEMLARQLSGAVQSLANWWFDHQAVPRAALLDSVMAFAWIGLQRVRDGERPGAPSGGSGGSDR